MSIQTAQNQVQTAIYKLLVPSGTLDAQLATIGVQGVYDFRAVKQNAQFPYITMGDGFEIPNNALGKRGYQYSATIHIWSQQPGTSEASAILSRINQLIDQQKLVLSAHAHVSTMYDRANWIADPDGMTLHVAARYQINTEEG